MDTVSTRTMMTVHIIYVSISKVHHPQEISVPLPGNLIGVPPPVRQNSGGQCDIENWCVCQWAFASYIQKAGGCDAIQDIQCDAINIQALRAYERDTQKYGQALACLYERCDVTSTE